MCGNSLPYFPKFISNHFLNNQLSKLIFIFTGLLEEIFFLYGEINLSIIQSIQLFGAYWEIDVLLP